MQVGTFPVTLPTHPRTRQHEHIPTEDLREWLSSQATEASQAGESEGVSGGGSRTGFLTPGTVDFFELDSSLLWGLSCAL